MIINSVNTAAPEIYGNYSAKKVEETAHESFAEAINDAMSENVNGKSNTDIAEFSEEDTEKISINGSYTVTDEEREYFREKYGEEYDEEKVGELYYELADKGIISETDAGEASGIGAVRLVDLSNAVYMGLGNCDLVSLINSGALKVRVGKRQYVEGTAFTDERAHKKDYDDFDSKYDKEVNTWEDALQKHMDFLEYFKEQSLKNTDSSEKRYPSGISFEMWQESLEKTKRIIEQIFR